MWSASSTWLTVPEKAILVRPGETRFDRQAVRLEPCHDGGDVGVRRAVSSAKLIRGVNHL